MQRHSTRPLCLDLVGLGEDRALVHRAMGDATFARLQEAKRRFDPKNLFRMNQNVAPG